MGPVRRFRVPAALAVVLACVLAPASAHGAWETLKILGNDAKELTPGGHIRLIGHSWWGPISNCKNRVAIHLIDSAGKKRKIGTVGPPEEGRGLIGRDVQSLWDIGGTVRVPASGIRAGPAQLLAVQRVKFRIPGLGCFQFARKQSRLSGLRILGAEGNDPPEVRDVAAPDFRQGRADKISWSQSEAGQAIVKVFFHFTAEQPLAVATLIDEQRPAGANTVDWNAMLGGAAVPAGAYRVSIQVRDADGSSSDVAQRDFRVGF